MGSRGYSNESECCSKCFSEEAANLGAIVRQRGAERPGITCCHCESTGGYYLAAKELRDVFQRLINHEYVPTNEMELPLDFLKQAESSYLTHLIEEDFGPIFFDGGSNDALLGSFIDDASSPYPMHPDDFFEDGPGYLDPEWSRRSEDWTQNDDGMFEHFDREEVWAVAPHLLSLPDAIELLRSLVDRRGHSTTFAKLLNDKSDKTVRNACIRIRQSIANVRLRLPKGQSFYRARIVPFPEAADLERSQIKREHMSAPPPKHVRAQRANVSGQPFLYLASTPEVAAAEVRPCVGNEVVIATFELRRDVFVADFRRSIDPLIPFCATDEEFNRFYKYVNDHNAFREHIGQHFARPCDNISAPGEYLLSQFICQWLLASEGIDGVAYESSQKSANECWNLALFSDHSVNMNTSAIEHRRVRGVDYEFETQTTSQ